MTPRELLLLAAVVGPAAAALLWLLLVRWPWPRRALAGLSWLGAQAVLWWVFWETFRGQAPSWRGLTPDLYGATLAAVAGAAVTIVLPRLDAERPRAAAAGIAAAAVGLTAGTAAAFTSSLVGLAVLVPVPTVAVWLAGAFGDRRGAPGVLGLAAADAAVIGGLLLLIERSGTTALAAVSPDGPGLSLVLLGAALKLGAVPLLGTWRAAAAEGVVSPLSVALRAQGAILVTIAALRVDDPSPVLLLLALAAAAVLLAGLSALVGPSPIDVLTAAVGAGAAAPFLALGLGGGVGARAALLLLPALVLGSGLVVAAAWGGPGDPHEPGPWWRRLGAFALGVGVLSVLGLPPGGGFPGTWLSLSLASSRAVVEPWHAAAIVAAAVGIGLAALAAIPALRHARTRPAPAVLVALAALALVYAGTQPVRLGLGWMVRVEGELGLPEVLPSAGAPALPAVGGTELGWVLLPAAAILTAVLASGRGVRDPAAGREPLVRRPAAPRWARRIEGLGRRLRLGVVVPVLLEAGAVAGAVWAVVRGMQLGFL